MFTISLVLYCLTRVFVLGASDAIPVARPESTHTAASAESCVEKACNNRTAAAATAKCGGDGDYDAPLARLIVQMGCRHNTNFRMCIERTTGMPRMVYFCSSEFCYTCGERWDAFYFVSPRRFVIPLTTGAIIFTGGAIVRRKGITEGSEMHDGNHRRGVETESSAPLGRNAGRVA